MNIGHLNHENSYFGSLVIIDHIIVYSVTSCINRLRTVQVFLNSRFDKTVSTINYFYKNIFTYGSCVTEVNNFYQISQSLRSEAIVYTENIHFISEQSYL